MRSAISPRFATRIFRIERAAIRCRCLDAEASRERPPPAGFHHDSLHFIVIVAEIEEGRALPRRIDSLEFGGLLEHRERDRDRDDNIGIGRFHSLLGSGYMPIA